MQNSKTKAFNTFARRLLGAGLAIMLFIFLAVPFLTTPKPVQALPCQTPEECAVVIPGGGFPVAITGNVYEEAKKKVRGFFVTLLQGGIISLMNAFQVFTQRLAYDAAQRILTGDAGQYPMFWEDDYDEYLAKVALDASDQFIDSVNSEIFNAYGFDLCTPIDPLKLSLSFGISQVEQLKAKCTFAKIGAAFEQTKDALDPEKVFENVAPQFDPRASELNASIVFHNKFIQTQANKVRDATLGRQETKGRKFVKDFISGKIKTPAEEVNTMFNYFNAAVQSGEATKANYLLLAVNAFGLGFQQLGLLTASTFVNTLASGAMQQLFDGLKNTALVDTQIDLAQSEGASNRNVAAARIVFSDLLTPNLISSDQQDFVAELSTCPTPRGLWGCSMDDAFATALRTVGETGAYTVGQAAHASFNGEPPTNPAFLHKDWELIPNSDVKENTDPTCYQRAYCATNLSKLRYARILPVGWEMAANSPYNKKRNGKYMTLEQVIRGFNVCNKNGGADAVHPWCKLIDPNWVLAAPPFQCRIKGFGDTVLEGTGLRLEECADAASCLGRDDNGKCTQGYGFCLAERPVWRFGADSCPEQFASCRTYQTRTNEQVSYLRNTLDYGSCSADNVGCMWYATERDPKSKDQDQWVGGISANSGPRVYFDGTVKGCSAADDGCTRLLEVQPGKGGLNLIRNGSFEQSPEEKPERLTGWRLMKDYPIAQHTIPNVKEEDEAKYVDPEVEAGDASYQGNRSYGKATDVTAVGESIAFAPGRYYTLSVYTRQVANKALNPSVLLWLLNKQGQPVAPINAYRSAGCDWNGSGKPGNPQGLIGFYKALKFDEFGAWHRLECTFVSNPDAVKGYVRVLAANSELIDAVQLEESSRAMSYADGLASDLPVQHMRVPPDEYACTGNAQKDNPLCARYARRCSQADVGCQGYRDVSNPALPEIPATLSPNDFCPATCVGYAEFIKMPSAFDLIKSSNPLLDDPQDESSAMFIPTTAQQCSLADVGCEEFTNVEQIAAGGESVGHYNYVRACEKPNENSETFFTWEGSDTTGYQLKTWSLINDPNKKGGDKGAPPKVLQKIDPDGILKDPAGCNDASWQTGADADCRQFFNAKGDVFYAYFSQTVVSSPECRDYRKNGSHAADCEKTGGVFTPATGECIYKILAKESRSCNQVNAGCRAYMGTTGRNTTLVFEEDFRAKEKAKPFTEGTFSNESVLVGDQSWKIEGKGKTATVFTSVPQQLYSLSFWAKTTDPKQPTVNVVVDGKTVGTVKLGVDWQRHEVGPFTGSVKEAFTSLEWANLPGKAVTFLDQIRVERLQDITYVVRNSWNTPAECNQTLQGLPQPQAMLGCRAYRNRDNQAVTVRQFGHLCREEAIGCKAFVDTRNSADPYAQSFALKGTDKNTKVTPEAQAREDMFLGTMSVGRPADRYIYLIDEPSARCRADQASCRAFGKPKFRQDQLALAASTSSAFETAYLIDDITAYLDKNGEPGILCRKNELFCEEYKSGKTVAYFRAPLDHACEWKDKVVLKASPNNNVPADGEYSGWFRAGTDIPCYPTMLSSGNTYLIQNSGDPSYVGWVGMCPVEQSECTEFRDPNDRSDAAHPLGKPYFFIKNQRLDLSSCGGKVDRTKGCVLFRDLSDSRLKYSSIATYAKSAKEHDSVQAPVDCVTDPSNPFCKENKVCTNVQITKCAGNGCKTVGEAGYFGCVADPVCKKIDETNKEYCAKAEKFCTGPDAVSQLMYSACKMDSDCVFQEEEPGDLGNKAASYSITGKCEAVNDANAVIKVKLDRDCSQWLGCSSAETVYDPAQQKYVDLCTEVAMCDQSKGMNAGDFCARYVNRAKDPILKTGVFFDRETYITRKTGFGEIDYSGYSIPDQFQATDVKNRRVAWALFDKMPSMANKFALDYRLAVAVPEWTGLVEFQDDVPELADKILTHLNICRHKQIGRTGYYQAADKGKRVCYFAVDSLTERTVEAGQKQKKDELMPDPRNIQPLSLIFDQSFDPKNDKVLQRAFPPPECKAHPESDAPFPKIYVKEWDFTRTPFKPSVVAIGYEEGNLCEYGEDCACSYRKVKYGGQLTKYFAPYGPAPFAGICSGGTNDGQSCVPSEKQAEGAKPQAIASQTGGDIGCGGGQCLSISDVALVQGQFGQCLQRDLSRSVAEDQGRNPCLVWNPSPILASTYDNYHYVPTAGYLPPINAGEYYCLSYANPPFENTWNMLSHTDWKDTQVRYSLPPGSSEWYPGGSADDGGNDFFILPGKLSKFNYDRGYIAGKCSAFSDTCGDGETACNCHDGISNIKAANRDFIEMMREARAGTVDAIKAIGAGYNKLVDYVQDVASREALFKIAEENPIDNSLDEVWRFQNMGQGIDGTAPDTNSYEDSIPMRCAQATGDVPGDKDADNGGPPGNDAGMSIDWNGIGAWDKAPDVDYGSGRWIMTGRGKGRTYMEYFFAARPSGILRWLNPEVTVAGLDGHPWKLKAQESLNQAMLERNFAQFHFFPTNDKFLSACRIPPHYVDGVGVADWTDRNQVGFASNQIMSALSRDFDGRLDRTKEEILKDANDKPIKEVCSGLNIDQDPNTPVNGQGSDGKCYFKYWETNYRLEGTPTFEWLNNLSGVSFWKRHGQYYSREATCSKSGFAIRALFENINAAQNDIPENEATDSQLYGPWRFIGFWVSACTAGTDKESFAYLSLKVKHADICKELAQVISPHSRESAAFSDRVWRGGSFAIPILGYTYTTNYMPFGSALANGLPGVEPLFQTGGPVENFSQLRPPTFLGSGQTLFSFREAPKFKWEHLSNIFARIYRVYDYLDAGVSNRDWACVGGPNLYGACPARPNKEEGAPEITEWESQVKAICGGLGKCETGFTTKQVKNRVARCSGLSGVNAGLTCGDGFPLVALDPVCHNAAMKRVNGALVPQLADCNLRPTWHADCDIAGQVWSSGLSPGDPNYSGGKKKVCLGASTAALMYNAFGCSDDSVSPGASCSKPEKGSKECPKRIKGGKDSKCIADGFGPMYGHCSNGFEHARCSHYLEGNESPKGNDADCEFTEKQWWGAYDNGKAKEYLLDKEEENWGESGTVNIIMTENYRSPVKNKDYNPQTQGKSVARPLPIRWPVSANDPQANDGNPWYRCSRLNCTKMSLNDGQQLQDAISPNTYYSRYGATMDAQGDQMMQTEQISSRWPSPYFVGWTGNKPLTQPGLCTGAMDADQDPDDHLGNKFDPAPFYSNGFLGGELAALVVGQCVGGIQDGQLCYSAVDYSNQSLNKSEYHYFGISCGREGTGGAELCEKVTQGDNVTPIQECLLLKGIAGHPDPNRDNNKCTHRMGYNPRTDLCSSQDDEKCLTYYDLESYAPNDLQLPPTDVTAGFHTPAFYNKENTNFYAYESIAHYAPRPPSVAAPDLSRTCATPGSCPIASPGMFALEDQAEGPLFFAGGKGQVTMRFYGWATHEQTPLKSLYIDWGDGTITKVEQARMKNKKPFCGASRECQNVPGLTCGSDADCPPGGGKCADTGTCASNPNRACSGDGDCQVGGKKGDKCNVRIMFGNSGEACEANYFEFTHAYTCDRVKMLDKCYKLSLGEQQDTKRCHRNPDVVCSGDGDCGAGDKCVPGLAPSSIEGAGGGCFDQEKTACRYTPKLMLKDSWNWCTGECRTEKAAGGLADASDSKTKHVYGGCWDGMETKKMGAMSGPIMEEERNECSPTLLLKKYEPNFKSFRPWIVYPGSVNIGIVK